MQVVRLSCGDGNEEDERQARQPAGKCSSDERCMVVISSWAMEMKKMNAKRANLQASVVVIRVRSSSHSSDEFVGVAKRANLQAINNIYTCRQVGCGRGLGVCGLGKSAPTCRGG